MIGAVRAAVVLGVLVLSATALLGAGHAHAFGLDDVAARAAKLAAAPYRKPDKSLPAAMKALDYDQFRDIRFRPDRAMWRNLKLPFEIMFFHRGWFYEDPVVIREEVETRFSPKIMVANYVAAYEATIAARE